MVNIFQIQKLADHRKATIETLKNIDSRESLLETLQSLVERFGAGQFVRKHLVAREVKNLIVSLRFATLETVESINRWREGVKNHSKPFVWRNFNYLLKMQTDTQFFIDSELRTMVEIVNSYNNPFLMPGTDFGQEKQSKNISPPRNMKKIQTNEGKKKLPPLRASSPTGRKTDPFKDRVSAAEKVVFMERSRSPGSPTQGAEKSPGTMKKQLERTLGPVKKNSLPAIPPLNIGTTITKKSRPKTPSTKKIPSRPISVAETVIPFKIDEGSLPELPPLPIDSAHAATCINAVLIGNKTRIEHDKQKLERIKLEKEKTEAQRLLEIKKKEQKEQTAATTIQSGFRGQKARAQVKVRKQQNVAVLSIQALFRSAHVRRQLLDQKQQGKAATKIQSRYRGIVARKSVGEKKQYKKQNKAATKIQSRYRAIVARKTVIEKKYAKKQAELKKSNHAALVLQKNQRMFKERKQFNNSLKSISCLQSNVRMYLARSHVKSLRNKYEEKLQETMRRDAEQYEAATKIQSITRGALQRPIFQKQRDAAITIQSAVRTFSAKLIVEEARKNRAAQKQQELRSVNAAVNIQCLIRQFLARRRHKKLKQKQAMNMLHFIAREKATMRLQMATRVLFAKQRFNEVKAGHLAAIKLQSMTRGRQARKLVFQKRQDISTTENALLTIQLAIRQFLAKQRVSSQRSTFAARLQKDLETEKQFYQNVNATTIQQAVRGHAANQRVNKLREQLYNHINAEIEKELVSYKNISADLIQRNVRVKLARNKTAKLRDLREKAKRAKQQQAIVELEKSNKMISLEPVVPVQKYTIEIKKPTQDQCATTVQRSVRVFLAKYKVRDLSRAFKQSLDKFIAQERYDDNVLISQRAIRRCIAIKKVEQLKVARQHQIIMQNRRSDAIFMIQIGVRSFLARKVVAKLRKEHAAATVIQSGARVRIAKREVEQIRQEKQQNVSASLLQRSTRCMIARSRVKKFKNEFEITTIKQVEQERIEWNQAAVKIQAGARAQIARRIRQQLQDEKQIREFDGACVIQGGIRVMIARNKISTARKSYIARINAEIAQELKQRNVAAAKIQANLRVLFARNEIRKEKREFEEQIETDLELERIVIEDEAVITIQSARRAQNARRIAEQRRQELILQELERKAEIERRREALRLAQEKREFKAATLLQCAALVMLARKNVQSTRKTFNAALAAELKQEKFEFEMAASRISKAFLAGKKKEAARTLQRALRIMNARNRVKLIRNQIKLQNDKHEEREKCACLLQRSIRLHLATRKVNKSRNELIKRMDTEIQLERSRVDAASVIQQSFRVSSAKQLTNQLAQQEEKRIQTEEKQFYAASTIQAALRVFLARSNVAKKRVAVSAKLDAEMQKEKIEYEKIYRVAAANAIQGAVRGHIAKTTLQHRKKQQESKIDAEITQEKKLMYESAVMIQQAIRASGAKRKRDLLVAAREKTVQKELQDEKLSYETSVARIQRSVRVSSAKRKTDILRMQKDAELDAEIERERLSMRAIIV
jgi:hypothetical protein